MNFIFESKGSTLEKLKNKIKTGIIPELYIFTINEWQNNSEVILEKIKKQFSKNIIIRSSSPLEDQDNQSNAGLFDSVPNVDITKDSQIQSAIETVIKSYSNVTNKYNDFEILIQEMIKDVKLNGVILTKDINTQGPYFTINFELNNNTDTITSGSSTTDQTFSVYKNINLNNHQLEKYLHQIIISVKEIEQLTNRDNLDIEFAISKSGIIFIFQVRPLIIKKELNGKTKLLINTKISNGTDAFRQHLNTKKRVFGDTTYFSNMTDWNPAELIGKHPSPLAFSLYKKIFTENSWNISRAKLGYNFVDNNNLVYLFCGRPYVDVRKVMNSYIPNNFSDSLKNKVINIYLSRFKDKKEFHDKVEFAIMPTCLVLNFKEYETILLEKGLTQIELNEYKTALLEMTKNMLQDKTKALKKAKKDFKKLKIKYRIYYKNNKIKDIDRILESCVTYGSIPFGVFVRSAFVGMQMLQSLIDISLITKEEYSKFLSSFQTITSNFLEDIQKLKENVIDKEQFLEEYGHLRPGTFDIRTLSYRELESFEQFLNNDKKSERIEILQNKVAYFHKANEIEEHIKSTGLNITFAELLEYIEQNFRMREESKFWVGKYVDLIFKKLLKFGEETNISREDLSYTKIEDFLNLKSPEISDIIKKRKFERNIESFILLDDVIINETDFFVISQKEMTPNFITNKCITKEVVFLDGSDDFNKDLNDKIVLLEKADPGYDWIFSKNIMGLITMYGGVASHMALRSYELDLPAAIGCGQVIFDKAKSSTVIKLDCLKKCIENIK